MRRISPAVISLIVSFAACGTKPPIEAGGGIGGIPGLYGGPTDPGDASSLDDASGNPGSTDAPSFAQAPHPAWPQIVVQGGTILTAPQILTVTFPEDSLAAGLQAFGAQAAKNSYWDIVREGYCTGECVGDGPPGTSVELATVAGASYTDSSRGGASTMQTFIEGLIESEAIPSPGPQSIPIFYFPSTTTITFDGATSCQGLGGFHNSMVSKASGIQFAYAVVFECGGSGKLSALEEATLAASHEIIEAATDPFATTATHGFYLNVDDPAYLPWNALAGGEVGDMCLDYLGLGQDQAIEAGFTVQRIWSNAAAAAGGDPCVPAKTTPYFNFAVEQWISTQTVGSTVTFKAEAFSNEAVPGGWTVTGIDLNASGSSTSPYLTITVGGVAAASVNNGDEVTVGVTLNQDPGALTQAAGGAVGLLLSYTGTSPQAATAGAIWPFLVQTPADALDSGLLGIDASEDLPMGPKITPTHLTREQLTRVVKLIHGLH